MKKIFTLALVAAGLTFTASAQSRNDRFNKQDAYQVSQTSENRNYSEQQSNNYAYNDRVQPKEDYRSQGQYERVNQDYDKRNDGYKNGRSDNRYERTGRTEERQEKGKAFGTGLVVGGLAVVLLGALFAHGN